MSKPALVLADEPTGNPDSRTSAEVMGLLQETGRLVKGDNHVSEQ